MKGFQRIFCILFIGMVFLRLVVPAYAQEEPMALTLEDAVKLGLKNSIALRQVETEIDLSDAAKERAKDASELLRMGDEQVIRGASKINQAEIALDHGLSPIDITLPDGTIIPAGSPIPDALKEEVYKELGKSKLQLQGGEALLEAGVQEAVSSIANKLGMETSYHLDVPSTRALMNTMAYEAHKVTKTSYDIYKNQIALLIQKNYYDVLKAQKMVEVKKKAVERGKKQYQFAKDGFEAGMKAKDDMLLANVYYTGTQMELRKAKAEFENALIELKKNMNISLDTKILLTDVLVEEIEPQDLNHGLSVGLENRLEIKKAKAEIKVHDLNYRFVDNNYNEHSPEHKEAKNLRRKANLRLEQAKMEVESSIRQSYELLQSTSEMLELSKEMVNQAKESVEISEYKYQEGFGVDTSLLKKLDLESAAGTMVEVLAAQENLAQIEEKVVQITYGYNLAKMKYLNDIGEFVY